MSVIWLPRWKCTSLSMSFRPRRSSSFSSRISSTADSPNLERSPPLLAQRPEPSVASLMRTPAVGSTPISSATLSSTSSSFSCSSTIITVWPSFWPMRASRMYSSSL